jgi:hypothetical protein
MSETKRCSGIRFTKKDLEYLVFGLDLSVKNLQAWDKVNMRNLALQIREVENLKARLWAILARMVE